MGDIYYAPPRQFIKECKFLENNYLRCLLQKGTKDNFNNECNLEYVWYFHTECPDYIKKYDDPLEGKNYLKKQMFNMMTLPYHYYKKEIAKTPTTQDSMPSLAKAGQFLEYPEYRKERLGTNSADLLFDKDLRSSFSEGAEFKPDPVVEAEAAEDDEE